MLRTFRYGLCELSALYARILQPSSRRVGVRLVRSPSLATGARAASIYVSEILLNDRNT